MSKPDPQAPRAHIWQIALEPPLNLDASLALMLMATDTRSETASGIREVGAS